MIRIGVFGGSFNPVHHGHLYIARMAMEEADIHRVLFVPAATPPHKQASTLASGVHRMAMLTLALADEGAMEISPVEMDLGAPPYTIDTLRALAQIHPHDHLSFIMGWDSLRDLHTWKEPEAILNEFEVIAVDRPGLKEHELQPKWTTRCRLLTGNPFGVSGTALRRRIALGKSIKYLTPQSVADYIHSSGLYSADS